MKKTNFFTELSSIGLKHLVIEMMVAENDSVTLFVTPKSNEISKSNTMGEAFKNIAPFTITGTAQQLDEEFFSTVTEPLAETGKIITNMESFRASLEEASKLASEKAKAKEKTPEVKKVDETPKPSKEELANLAKMNKAETAVKDQLALCTNYTTFNKNKAKLKKAIDALKATIESTKLEAQFYLSALEFFEANNVIMDGSFIALKIESTKEDVLPPIEVEEQTLIEEAVVIEIQDEQEDVEDIEDDEEQPGQSLAQMNAERTEERKSQLSSLGMSESSTGYTGYGFDVRHSIIEGHTAEYWDELLKGITAEFNRTSNVAEDIVAPAPSAPSADLAPAPLPELAPEPIAEMTIVKDEEIERFKIRTARLEEIGFVKSGKDFVQNHFVVSVELVKTNNDDAWFEKVIEHFVCEIAQWKQRTQDRIAELATYEITEVSPNKFSHKSQSISLSIVEITNEPDDRWKMGIESIKGMISNLKTPHPEKTNLVFILNANAPHSYDAYIKSGWNDQQLVQQGLGVFVETPKKEEAPSSPAAPPAPSAPTSFLDTNDNQIL